MPVRLRHDGKVQLREQFELDVACLWFHYFVGSFLGERLNEGGKTERKRSEKGERRPKARLMTTNC
jgi:hypothetical protein